jgi:serine/threonine-protein kinase ULK/ATG1
VYPPHGSYVAPEILSYQKHDAKADLWSVGAVLYEMSVGKVPFRDSNHIELLKKIDHSKGIKFPEEDPLHQPCPEEDAP